MKTMLFFKVLVMCQICIKENFLLQHLLDIYQGEFWQHMEICNELAKKLLSVINLPIKNFKTIFEEERETSSDQSFP
jgi:hypothetical protein